MDQISPAKTARLLSVPRRLNLDRRLAIPPRCFLPTVRDFPTFGPLQLAERLARHSQILVDLVTLPTTHSYIPYCQSILGQHGKEVASATGLNGPDWFIAQSGWDLEGSGCGGWPVHGSEVLYQTAAHLCRTVRAVEIWSRWRNGRNQTTDKERCVAPQTIDV